MRLLKLSLWFALILWTMPARSQTDIHRCIDANGHALFTDQTCASMQATAVHTAPRPVEETTQVATLAATPTEPPPILCAATFDELRQSVIDAFASHSANRLAGLMLWNGYGSASAVANIRALGVLMQQSLLDAGPPDGTAASATPYANASSDGEPPAGAPGAGSQLVLHLAGTDSGGNPRELRYDVVHRYGCLWLARGD